MISYIKGKIIAKGDEFLIIETNGLGYKVFVGDKIWQKAEVGREIELFTITALKRDTLELYGCPSWEEFQFLHLLLKISGVGPKTGLVLAEFGSVEKLKKGLEQRGEASGKKIKGLGKKKMQRILLELTGKIQQFKAEVVSEKTEPESALLALGFSKQEIQRALSKVPSEIKGTEEIVKRALGLLGDPQK